MYGALALLRSQMLNILDIHLFIYIFTYILDDKSFYNGIKLQRVYCSLNQILVVFQIKRNLIVGTVFLLIVNQRIFRLVHNKK